jgi:hypothetical protein
MALLALGLAVIALVGPWGARSVAAATAKWAWVVVRQSSGDYVPRARDRGNSEGSAVSVTDLAGLFGAGVYGISFDGVGTAHGIVLVSTLGTGARMCQADSWDITNDDVSVLIVCYDRAGAPSRATFIVNWLAGEGTGGRLAYARNFSPTSNCGKPADIYHSLGGAISVCPLQGSQAEIRIEQLGSSRGTAQVSATTRRATSGDVPSAGYCGVIAFYAARNLTRDEWVDAQCFESDGSPQIYREHDVWFMQGLGMKGVDRTNVAYLLADRQKSSSYVPDHAYAYSSAHKDARVRRQGKGRYLVTLPGMPKGGSAQVTPYGRAQRRCVIASISTRSLPQQVGVRCFDGQGDPRDSAFTLAYAK